MRYEQRMGSRQAALEMANSALAPDGTTGTGANLLSLFQVNAIAIAVEVFFGLEKIRTGGVAAISGIAWV